MPIHEEIAKTSVGAESEAPECRKTFSADYVTAREQIIHFLIQYTLIESFFTFRAARKPYPFVSRPSLRPGSITSTLEHVLHKNALVFLVDGQINERLHKHFRVRTGNRALKKNLAAVAPNLPDFDSFDAEKCFLRHPDFFNMMRLLLPLDFALMVQQADPEDRSEGFALTHFHVKIECLTDTALRNLAVHLNYIHKGLHERDDAFVETLEKKFFEYFNFYHNAAGRRSAAALSAHLLMREKLVGTVFVTSQQDRRLTVLSSMGMCKRVEIDQYMLQYLDSTELRELKAWGRRNDLDILKDFVLHHTQKGGVVLFRTRYRHTEHALPSKNGALKTELNPREKWARLMDEVIMPLNPVEQPNCIEYPLAYRRASAEENG